MKLSKKHIGQLFDVEGGDGSWAYQLIDMNQIYLLFYSLNGKFWKERRYPSCRSDWRPFEPQLQSIDIVKHGWATAKEIL